MEVEDASREDLLKGAKIAGTHLMENDAKAMWIEGLESLTALTSLKLVPKVQDYATCFQFHYFVNVVPCLRHLQHLSLWRHCGHTNCAWEKLATGLKDTEGLEIGWALQVWPLPLVTDFGQCPQPDNDDDDDQDN